METIYYSMNFFIYCCLMADMRQAALGPVKRIPSAIKSFLPYRRRLYNID
jgi:hypothetical protein